MCKRSGGPKQMEVLKKNSSCIVILLLSWLFKIPCYSNTFSLTFANKWLNVGLLKIGWHFSGKFIYFWLPTLANHCLKKKKNPQPKIFQETGAQTSSRKPGVIRNIIVKIAV